MFCLKTGSTGLFFFFVMESFGGYDVEQFSVHLCLGDVGHLFLLKSAGCCSTVVFVFDGHGDGSGFFFHLLG